MSWIIFVLVIAVVAAIAARALFTSAYYRRMFAPAHLQEFYQGFIATLDAAQSATTVEEDQLPAHVVTSAGLALAITASRANGHRVIHLSLSQQGRPTTSAVASRFGFLILCALDNNGLTCDAFRTESRAHHLVFTGKDAPLVIDAFDAVMVSYQTSYSPVPFRFQGAPPG